MSDYRIDIVVDPTAAAAGSTIAADGLDVVAVAGERAQMATQGLAASFGEMSAAATPAAGAMERLSASIAEMEAAASGGGFLSGLGDSLKGLAAVGGGIEIFSLANGLGELENRLRVVTTSEAQLKDVTEQLYHVSQETRTSWESTAETYQRVFLATRDLGLSQEQVIRFTKELNEAFVVAGVSAGEQSRVMRDLMHGLDQGTLNWRNLQQVMSQAPSVARIIADHFGVATGKLKELASQGKITAQDLVAAFDEAAPKLDDAFAKTTPTLKQSWIELENAVMHFLQVLQPVIELVAKAIGGIATALDFVSDHAETTIAVVAPLLGPEGLLITGAIALHKLFGLLPNSLGDTIDALLRMNKEAEDLESTMSGMRVMTDAAQIAFIKAKASGALYTEALHEMEAGLKAVTEQSLLSRDSLEVYETQVKSFTEETIRLVHKLQQEHKDAARAAEEHARQIIALKNALDEIAGKASPLAEAEKKVADAEEKINKARREGITITPEVIAGLDALKGKVLELHAAEIASQTIKGTFDELAASVKQFAVNLDAGATAQNKLFGGNNALMMPEWEKATNFKEKASQLEVFRAELERLATPTDVLKNAFNSMNNEFLNFLQNGKVNWSGFVTSVETDIERLLIKEAELALFNLIFGAASGGGSIPFMLGPGGIQTGVPGFATGGSWTVGGDTGSTDAVPQIFRATRGERITVETATERASASGRSTLGPRGVTVIMDARRAVSEGIKSRTGLRSMVNLLEYNPSAFGNAVR